MTSPTETPAPKVVCESQNCGKEYASRGGMKTHYKKSHKTAEEIQSPLGKFPTSDPARILFRESEPSTQGNSKGQVNSPKISSAGQYICDVCDNYFESKKNVDDHKIKEHDNPSFTATAPPSAPMTATNVQTIVSFLCGACDMQFSQNQEAQLHMNKAHTKSSDKGSDDSTTPTAATDKESGDSTHSHI